MSEDLSDIIQYFNVVNQKITLNLKEDCKMSKFTKDNNFFCYVYDYKDAILIKLIKIINNEVKVWEKRLFLKEN